MDICVIIPTYNEKENIADLVQQILDLDIGARVIVVDDNSPDGTGQIVDDLTRQESHVQVIHRAGKLGLGPIRADVSRPWSLAQAMART